MHIVGPATAKFLLHRATKSRSTGGLTSHALPGPLTQIMTGASSASVRNPSSLARSASSDDFRASALLKTCATSCRRSIVWLGHSRPFARRGKRNNPLPQSDRQWRAGGPRATSCRSVSSDLALYRHPGRHQITTPNTPVLPLKNFCQRPQGTRRAPRRHGKSARSSCCPPVKRQHEVVPPLIGRPETTCRDPDRVPQSQAGAARPR